MRRFWAGLALVGAMTGSMALAADANPIKAEMKTVVDPASTVLFTIAGEADPANGAGATPPAAVRWREAGMAAARIRQVAAALQSPAQSRPGAEWTVNVKRLADLSEAAERAARTRNGARLAQAANDLGDVCTACHAKYRPAPAG